MKITITSIVLSLIAIGFWAWYLWFEKPNDNFLFEEIYEKGVKCESYEQQLKTIPEEFRGIGIISKVEGATSSCYFVGNYGYTCFPPETKIKEVRDSNGRLIKIIVNY